MDYNFLEQMIKDHGVVDKSYYNKYDVKRGLRNRDGSGVIAGLTQIGEVKGFVMDDLEVIPIEGKLKYRGININTIVEHLKSKKRFMFEEVMYLLLFGKLPTQTEEKEFIELLQKNMILPDEFIEDIIRKHPSKDIMNNLARSVLACFSFDNSSDEIDLAASVKQSLNLIAKFPPIIAYAYQAKMEKYENKTPFYNRPLKELSIAENFLRMIRPDGKFTDLEAEILDLALVLHAEHGGGNNSTFTTHVVTSALTDTYSVIAASVGSLKGARHGGANLKVNFMMDDFKRNIKDWTDKEEVKKYIIKVLRKEAYDKTGLVYGVGHGVYTRSDPRALILKDYARQLAKMKGKENEFALYELVEEQVPLAVSEFKGKKLVVSPNVDFYSGFVYKILGIPFDLNTPIFAMARIVGWSAHRLEEIASGEKIIRPAYKNVIGECEYIPQDKRL